MATTPTFGWPLPDKEGLQRDEIDRAAQALIAVDLRVGSMQVAHTALQTAFDAHTHSFGSLIGKPTTVVGYGITDAYTKIETDAKITAKFADFIGNAPATLDTIYEIAAALGNDPNAITTIITSLGGKLAKDQNLNDLPDKATARANLGANDAGNLTSGSLPPARFSDISHGYRGGGLLHERASEFAAGFMSSADKKKLDSGVLSSFRNKIINGDFDIWQRGGSFSAVSYTADRWRISFGGGGTNSVIVNKQTHGIWQTSVPGIPQYYASANVLASSGTSDCYAVLAQKIEGVRTLAGKTATITFYAKADSNKSISIELAQHFGTGGSASLYGIGSTKFSLSTTWQKFMLVLNVPSIAGKVIGSTPTDCLDVIFWLSSGTDFNSRTGAPSPLGVQTGIFDISHVSIVEGDASNELDPFSARHTQQELALCQRYAYAVPRLIMAGYGTAGAWVYCYRAHPVTMRRTPTVSVSIASPTNMSGVGLNYVSSDVFEYAGYPTVDGRCECVITGVVDAEL